MTVIGVANYELAPDERVVQESATICSIEFEKQDEFLEALIGERLKGRVFAKPYLTDKKILVWLLAVPDVGEPKAFWYEFAYENINYMRPGKQGKHSGGQKGLEIEFAAPKVGGIAAGVGKRLEERGGLMGWMGKRIGLEKIKLWLYMPDSQVWYLNITKVLQQKGIKV